MDNDDILLDSRAAIQFVMDELGYHSYYKIAKKLTEDGLKVQAIQVSDYHKGTHAMGEKVAAQFSKTFGVAIADTFRSQGRPTEW